MILWRLRHSGEAENDKNNNTNNGERAERRRAAGVSGHEEQLRPCGSRPHTHCATLNHFLASRNPNGVCQRQLQSVKNLWPHRPCGLMLATGASAPSWRRATSYPPPNRRGGPRRRSLRPLSTQPTPQLQCCAAMADECNSVPAQQYFKTFLS